MSGRLLTPADVAGMLGVNADAVLDLAERGRLTVVRTIGGHRRYRESEVREILAARDERQRSLAEQGAP